MVTDLSPACHCRGGVGGVTERNIGTRLLRLLMRGKTPPYIGWTSDTDIGIMELWGVDLT
jgi:hypothetical protein